MPATDSAFAGSIPQLYDRFLGPLLFIPYAEEVARRVVEIKPKHVLETASGTGIVTEAIHRAAPDARIVATDLNQAMLDVAAGKLRSDRICFQVADAQHLPFADESFDLVVCQFGVMFFPDKVKANSEARRVLSDGGRYLLVIWDRLELNTASIIASDAVAALYPDDPPAFLPRTPFGYADRARIEEDLRAAGFSDIRFETVERMSLPSDPQSAAIGLVRGSPLSADILARDPNGLDRATVAASRALNGLLGPDGFDSRLSAHIVTATR
jgi:ubiquinone/menaquinone biosynthesis C-methylase UbiE